MIGESMSKASHAQKSAQLGMNHSTAAGKLRHQLLWALVVETGKDNCYQCGKPIGGIDQFSIEHKVRWMNSANPSALFFDLDNIAYSHRKCNVARNCPDKRAL